MAIYHFSAQIISRGKGQSAVAAAAYRSGENLNDQRTNQTKFYKREVQPDTMILAPSHAPEWVQDRNRLWNEVEKIEKHAKSQLAREVNIALPKELSHDQQKELIREYAQREFVDKGMVADISIHRDDEDNPHAHIMLTMRPFNEDGTWGNKKKKVYELDQNGEKILDKKGKPKYKTHFLTDWDQKKTLEKWREKWANYANKALERERIEERISHLSNEAQGLEQLPTIHLGHVAHKMEKRGVQTDRGNINRERQEYNNLVVELETYRKEKQALKEKENTQQFNTPVERTVLQNASKILKNEPSLENIKKRYNQLDKWDERLNKNDSYIRWKNETIQGASEHFKRIDLFNKEIQTAEKQIENINWLNPLKLKENRITKERAEQEISKAKGEIKFHNEKLNYHREKLGFNSEKEFNQIKTQHEIEQPGLIQKNRNTRQYIHSERDMLQKAEMAHKNAFVRQLASLYPERPEMRHMSFKTALKLVDVNSKYGKGKVVPIETIEKTVNSRKTEIQKLQKEVYRVDQTKERLQRAESYLKNFEKHQAIIEKYENNPLLKGKLLVSKSAKQEYENAITNRNTYKNYMKKEGISGRADFEKQVKAFNEIETKIPEYQTQIQSLEKGFGLLNAVIDGIKQAGQEMTKEQKQKEQDIKGKRKKKNIHQSYGIDR
ncbi:MobQ family relaxase [Cytobacillus sp. FSL M8-0252]|uniref:MobQ family relaxase n=1 Tax=Cytobacillus sp. FSL M8-0252 TaxID=2921621 RepID=UPI0030F92D52